jgi:heme/copper-type cytochrome/quinol oxidase subunit 3
MMLRNEKNHRVPPAAATVGMWLFLAALTMLFGATMIGYAIIRSRSTSAAAPGSLHLPPLLWLSTAAMLFASVTIHRALSAVRRERQAQLRQALVLTCALAAIFVVVQTPSMWELLHSQTHLAPSANAQGERLYQLIFALILIHALHVLGGIVGLGLTTRHAFQHRYDHEHYNGVKHAAMYWHFLDGVWIVMFLGITLAR